MEKNLNLPFLYMQFPPIVSEICSSLQSPDTERWLQLERDTALHSLFSIQAIFAYSRLSNAFPCVFM